MQTTPDFVVFLDSYLEQASFVAAGLSVLILLYHEIRLLLIKDLKSKYDYVTQHEVRNFWMAALPMILAVALYLNAMASHLTSLFATVTTWFYVRTFLTMSFVVIVYYLCYTLINIYYPAYVEKKLNRLRNKPRISPMGNPMRKLAEQEEEAHLDEAQWNEQRQVHSVDYDVWIDDVTGYKHIEKYVASQHAIQCPECGYVTLRIKNEELVKTPTQEDAGVLKKHYLCSYCKHREVWDVNLAPLSAPETAMEEA